MIRILIFLLAAFCFFLRGGELDDFADDVDFLKNAYREVKHAKRNAPIKQEYTKRILRAKARAARMQRDLNRLGVRRITLDSTLRKMLAFLPVNGINSKSLHSEAGTLNMHYNELCSQIKYLKELNYSPENGTLENPYPGSDSYDALYRFESLFRRCTAIAVGTGPLSASVKKHYDDNIKDLRILASVMARHIHSTKFEVPSGFAIEHNLAEFHRAAGKSIAVRLRKDARNSKDRKRMTSSKSYKVSSSSVKFWAERIQNEIEYLRKANFDFRVRKSNLTAIASRPAASEDEITEESGKPLFDELWRRYTRKRDALFHSESRVRGVSEDFYRRYRALLPAAQQNELDSLCRKSLEQEMPAEFARSNAVKTMHTRYRFRPDAYSADFLAGILNKNE